MILNAERPWANNRLRLAVTSRCNIGCVYCHNEGQPKAGDFLDYGLFGAIIELLSYGDQRLTTITFTGGEPLLHRGLERMLAACRPFANRLVVVTNGLLLTRARARALKSAGVDKIRVGVDSLTKETTRPTPGLASPQVVLDAIEALRDNSIWFELNVVITSFNKNEMCELLEYCRTNRVSAKFFEHVRVTRTAETTITALRQEAQLEFAHFASLVETELGIGPLEVCPEYGPANHVCYADGFSIRYCRYLCPYRRCYKTGTRIDPQGNVYACMRNAGRYRITTIQTPAEMMETVIMATEVGCGVGLPVVC